MSHVLTRSVLFNLHVLGDFIVIFLLLISCLIPLYSEGRNFMISILFKFVKVCFMAQKVVFVNVTHVLEKNVYPAVRQ